MLSSPRGPAKDEAAEADETSGFVYRGEERRRAPRSPMARLQWALPPLEALLPEAVPTRAAVLAALDPETLAACRRAAAGPAGDRDAALARLAACLPTDRRLRACDPPALVAAGVAADPEVHDAFFRIARAGHGHPAGYLHTLLAARSVFERDLAEARTTLRAENLAAIARALEAGIAAAIGVPAPSAPAPADAAPAGLALDGARPMTTESAVRRWIHGHQIFAALTQGLIFAFAAIEAAVASGEEAGLADGAALAATGLDGCSAALRLTGDFPPEVYEELIRVSMDSPFQPDGFSGLLSSDHRHLVRQMKLARPSLDALRDRAPVRYERIAAALAGVYEAHKCVCSRFVGTDRSSLMMVRDVGRSAIDHLDRFKAARMRAIGAGEPAAS